MQPKLVFREGLHRLVFPNGRELVADFGQDPRYQRRLRGKNELIAKAVGMKAGFSPRVWDLSLGLGEDAWTLARLGCQVTGFERQSLLVRWLRDSLAEFSSRNEDPVLAAALQRFSVEEGDALEVLRGPLLRASEPPDVLYFDPMYQESGKKSALPRIEMQIFREWIGEDSDQAEVLRTARETCRVRRIVVKRPHRAPELLAGVSHRFEGEKVRYDMYLTDLDRSSPSAKKGESK